MKTKGRRVSSNISVVDPKTNARDRADYKKEQENEKALQKVLMEDRAIMSPYLTDPKKMKDQAPQQVDKIIASQKNNFPMNKAMRLKHLTGETYPAQKFSKQKAKSGKSNRIQVTPGKWTSVNTVSVD